MSKSKRVLVSLTLAAVACREPAPVLVAARTTNSATSTVVSDAGGAGSADAASIEVPGGTGPVPGPTGTIEGVVLLDGPLPEPERIEVPTTFQSTPGCADAARRYAQPFDVTTPGPFPGALVSAEARAPGLGAPIPRRMSVRDCDITPRFIFAKENDPIYLALDSRRPHLPTIMGSGSSIDQLLIPGQPDRLLQFPGPGTFPVRIRDLPEFVGGMIYRLRQRFIDTTDIQGRFRIPEVPVASVVVNAWYPNVRQSQQTVTVVAGQTARLEFHLVAVPRRREPLQGIRHSDGTVRTEAGVIIPQ
jgi:hypothetical protein